MLKFVSARLGRAMELKPEAAVVAF